MAQLVSTQERFDSYVALRTRAKWLTAKSYTEFLNLS